MIKGTVPLYYKCVECEKFKEITKRRRKFCSDSCRMKDYYKRKHGKI